MFVVCFFCCVSLCSVYLLLCCFGVVWCGLELCCVEGRCLLLRLVHSDLISTLRDISTLTVSLRDIVTCILCCSALHGSVSVLCL